MAEIFIDGFIDDWAEFLATEQIREGKNDNELNIYITSLGGFILSGLNILAKLNAHPATVKNVYITGNVASMGTIIAMVKGANVSMSDEGFFLVHNPWGCMCGESEDFRKEADALDKFRDKLVDIYMKRVGISRDEIATLMDAEIWLTPQEALEMGFIDEISEPVAIAASAVKELQSGVFNNLPESLKAQLEKGAENMGADITDNEEVDNEEVDNNETEDENSEDSEDENSESQNSDESNDEHEDDDEDNDDEDGKAEKKKSFVGKLLDKLRAGKKNKKAKIVKKTKNKSTKKVDYKAKYEALKAESDELAKLDDEQQVVIKNLEDDLAEMEQVSDSILDAVIEGKVSKAQLLQHKNGKISDERLLDLIGLNGDIGTVKKVNKKDVVETEPETLGEKLAKITDPIAQTLAYQKIQRDKQANLKDN